MWENGKEDTVPHKLRLGADPDPAPKKKRAGSGFIVFGSGFGPK